MNILDDLVPDLGWFENRFKDVVWAENPRDQVATNLLLFALAVVSSSVTLGATVLFAFIFGFFGLIGVLRFIVDFAR